MATRCELLLEEREGVLYLGLVGAADVAAAAELCGELAAALSTARDVVVDLSRVERLDGAGLQLLLAAKVAMEACERRFVVVATSESAHAAIELAAAKSLLA